MVSIDTTEGNISIKKRNLQIYKLQMPDSALMDDRITENILNTLKDVVD